MALFLQMKKKSHAGVNTKKRLHLVFIKKKKKKFKFRARPRKIIKIIRKKKEKTPIRNLGKMILKNLLSKKVLKTPLVRLKRKKSKKNIKLHMKVYKFFNVFTKQKSVLAFNKFRQLFMLYTKKRIFFRNKPYNYKLRKMRQPKWLFKYNKRRRKLKKKNLHQRIAKRLIKKKMVNAIKKNTTLLKLLKLKKFYLMKKYSNAPLIKNVKRPVNVNKPKKRKIFPESTRRIMRKKKKEKLKRLKRAHRRRKSKMKILLKRIKVITRTRYK